MKAIAGVVLSCGAVYNAVQGGSNSWWKDEILKYDHLNESYWAVLSCGAVYNAVQGGSNSWWKDEILKYDHLNESYREVLFCGAVHYAVQTVESMNEIHSNESYWIVLFIGILIKKGKKNTHLRTHNLHFRPWPSWSPCFVYLWNTKLWSTMCLFPFTIIPFVLRMMFRFMVPSTPMLGGAPSKRSPYLGL